VDVENLFLAGAALGGCGCAAVIVVAKITFQSCKKAARVVMELVALFKRADVVGVVARHQ
jgi:hypothetical protein